MTKKEKIYNMQQIREELKASNGLPENLSTEAQLWDEIMKKEAFLIPFLPLRFRKRIRSGKNRSGLPKEELTSFYQQLILILDEEVAENHLSENNRNIILNLLNKSMIRIFYKNEALLKEVVTMTEPILELEIEKYIRSLDEKMEAIAKMGADIATKDAVIAEMDADIAKKDDVIAEMGADIAKKDDVIAEMDATISQKESAISKKDDEIAALRKQLAELQLAQK